MGETSLTPSLAHEPQNHQIRGHSDSNAKPDQITLNSITLLALFLNLKWDELPENQGVEGKKWFICSKSNYRRRWWWGGEGGRDPETMKQNSTTRKCHAAQIIKSAGRSRMWSRNLTALPCNRGSSLAIRSQHGFILHLDKALNKYSVQTVSKIFIISCFCNQIKGTGGCCQRWV